MMDIIRGMIHHSGEGLASSTASWSGLIAPGPRPARRLAGLFLAKPGARRKPRVSRRLRVGLIQRLAITLHAKHQCHSSKDGDGPDFGEYLVESVALEQDAADNAQEVSEREDLP